MFWVDWSYGEALPGSVGTIPNPYTSVHPNAHGARANYIGTRYQHPVRHRSVKSGSRWRATACSAHREMSVSMATQRRVGFLDFQARNEAVVNRLMQECGSGTQRLGPQSQAGRFAHLLEYGFTGSNVGCLGHGLLHLREGACSRVGTSLKWQCVSAIDQAPGAGSAQAVSGVVRGGAAAKGLAAAINETRGL